MKNKKKVPQTWKESLDLGYLKDYELVSRITEAYKSNNTEIELARKEGPSVKFRIKQVNPEGVLGWEI